VARTVVICSSLLALGGCTVVDGAMSALAFLVILAPVLRMLAIKPTEEEARRTM
jgi:hypothetical protein